jgi:5-methylcytosine-specific restriction protein A
MIRYLWGLWNTLQPVESRSSQWSRVRDQYLERWSWCAACGRKDSLEVHHIVPVSVDSSKELELDNLITLCRTSCHLLLGHLGDWGSWNDQIRVDAAELARKIRNRPRR